MFRKHMLALVLCVTLLLTISTLAAAQGQNELAFQDGMGMETATPQPIPTAVADLPLSGNLPLAGAQTGTCPMMGGDTSGMSGMSGAGMAGMSGTSGMNGMAGMNINGTTGMSGMSGMSGVPGQGMVDLERTGFNAWLYSLPNPWYLLGWVLLTLILAAILAGAALGIIQLLRRPQPMPAKD
jgi:hypothetical protein